MALYVPGTDEIDPKKLIMSQQLVAGQTSTNTTNIATNTSDIATVNGLRASSSTFGLAKVDGTSITATAGVVSTVIASQADQETSTSVVASVTPGRQQFHPSASKAWVKFTGSGSNGAQTITASYNVSGVSRTATGLYTVTFTTAFSSANYACFVTEVAGATNGWGQVQSEAAGSVNVGFVTLGPAAFDPGSGMVLCLGDQ